MRVEMAIEDVCESLQETGPLTNLHSGNAEGVRAMRHPVPAVHDLVQLFCNKVLRLGFRPSGIRKRVARQKRWHLARRAERGLDLPYGKRALAIGLAETADIPAPVRRTAEPRGSPKRARTIRNR